MTVLCFKRTSSVFSACKQSLKYWQENALTVSLKVLLIDESDGTTCGLRHFVIAKGIHFRKKEITFSLMSPFGVACDEKINDLNKYLFLVRRLA